MESLFTTINSNRGQRYELQPNELGSILINGGKADDTYVFGSPENGLNAPVGTRANFNVTINDRGGNDAVYIYDRATRGQFKPGSISTDYVYTVNDQFVTRDVFDQTTNQYGQPVTEGHQFKVKYAGLESIDLYGGDIAAKYVLSGFTGTLLGVHSGFKNDHGVLGTAIDGFKNFKVQKATSLDPCKTISRLKTWEASMT